MTFFKDTNGKALKASSTFSPGITLPIPDNSQLVCTVSSAKWVTGEKSHVAIEIMVSQPGPHKGRLVRSKLSYADSDTVKAEKALKMLLTFDSIGNKLLSKADSEGEKIIGNDNLLKRSIVGAKAIVTFGVWELERDDGSTMTGNWIREVRPAVADKEIEENNKSTSKYAAEDEGEFGDSDIPFN